MVWLELLETKMFDYGLFGSYKDHSDFFGGPIFRSFNPQVVSGCSTKVGGG